MKNQILPHSESGRWSHRLIAAVGLLSMGLLLAGADAAIGDQEISDAERQKQTVMDLRRISKAVHQWSVDAVDQGQGIAEPAGKHLRDGRLHISDYQPVTAEQLEQLLVPAYLDQLPTRDGWGHPFEFRANLNQLGSGKLLLTRSSGRDGVFESDSYAVEGFHFEQFDRDIVHADGYFLTWPTANQVSSGAP